MVRPTGDVLRASIFHDGKVGVGKTMFAFLLGLVLQRAGRRVAFLDLDPQASLNSLLNLHNVQPQEETHAEFLIVDKPPRLESKEIGEVIRQADIICIPMRPSPMDFRVTTNTAELVTRLKRAESRAKNSVEICDRHGPYSSNRASNTDMPLSLLNFREFAEKRRMLLKLKFAELLEI